MKKALNLFDLFCVPNFYSSKFLLNKIGQISFILAYLTWEYTLLVDLVALKKVLVVIALEKAVSSS